MPWISEDVVKSGFRLGPAAAAAVEHGAADLAIDEGTSNTGRRCGFRPHANGNGNGTGTSPVSTNSRAPHQNIIFSPINNEDSPHERTSGESHQASCMQDINDALADVDISVFALSCLTDQWGSERTLRISIFTCIGR
jgi:hypothetical protein